MLEEQLYYSVFGKDVSIIVLRSDKHHLQDPIFHIVSDKMLSGIHMLGPLTCSVAVSHVDGSNIIHVNDNWIL